MMTEIRLEQTIEIKNKMIEGKNDQIVKLEMEVERLRSELSYIANTKPLDSFTDYQGFAIWVINRARHALNQQPGTLAVRR
jgi:uncharacterized coiled-coil protein SlyX